MNQPINPAPKTSPQHPKKLLWLYILIVFLLLVGGFFGWSYFANNTAQGGAETTGVATPDQNKEETPVAIDCEKYINQTYGFSINYPKNWTYEEKTSAGTLREVIFSNKSLGDGYNVTVSIANKTGAIEPPDGMEPEITKDITIADLAGKNFDDAAYIFDNDKYRFSVTVDPNADQTLKIMARFLANSFQLNS